MVAFLPLPSVAFAVIVTVFPIPAFFAVTTPLLFTVAYFVFEDIHSIFLLALLPFVFTLAYTVIFVATQFTGLDGKYVPIAETIRGFKEILEGKHDDVPESYFLNVGSIDEVRAKMQ